MMMQWAMAMARHPKEVREFQFALKAIQPVMTDTQETRENKRATLNMMVNELSEDAFKLKPIVEQIMTIINMEEEVCREYSDSEAQTNGILRWLPRMKEHQDMLLTEVKEHRKSYDLEV